MTVPLVGGDGWDSPSLYQIGGAALHGSYFSNHYSPDDTDPIVQKFVSDYKTQYGSVPDALAATAYDAARIMFDAIKRANSLDGAAIRDALAATKDFPGVTGKVTFNENRDAVKPIVMVKIENGGKFVVAERVQVEGAAMPYQRRFAEQLHHRLQVRRRLRLRRLPQQLQPDRRQPLAARCEVAGGHVPRRRQPFRNLAF